MDAAAAPVRDCWMGIGKRVAAFEKKFSEYRGIDNFVMLDSGSNALIMAVKLLDLPLGSEILVPSFTWVACANAVVVCGHKVRFCDVDYGTGNVSAETVVKSITKNTKAIMVVHYAGHPVEMDDLKIFGLPIIEDVAHAVVSSYKDVPCGSLGDVAIFSFDSVKNLATPEGGGLSSVDKSLVKKARDLRYCGISQSGLEASKSKDRWWEYQINECLPKMIPTDVSAAVGLAQLERLDVMQWRRKEIWDFYKAELKGVKLPPEAPPHCQHSYFTFLIKVGKRDELARKLLDNGIYTNLRYHPLHLNPIYKSDQTLPNCERLNETGLNLPLHPRMTLDDAEKVVRHVSA